MSEGAASTYSVSVIVPAHNEEATIAAVLQRVRSAVRGLKEIIVVDDGSRDTTCRRVEELGLAEVRLIRQPRNHGKTAAVRRALREVTGDIVVIQDADLELDPGELDGVIAPIVAGRADCVYGSRFLGKDRTSAPSLAHYLANRALTQFSNVLTGANLTDIETCYKVFRAPLLKEMPITSAGYGMEVEITATITKTEARICEVPISYFPRTREQGKKISVSDGVAALWYLFFYNVVAPRTARRRLYIKRANIFLDQCRGAAPPSLGSQAGTRN